MPTTLLQPRPAADSRLDWPQRDRLQRDRSRLDAKGGVRANRRRADAPPRQPRVVVPGSSASVPGSSASVPGSSASAGAGFAQGRGPRARTAVGVRPHLGRERAPTLSLVARVQALLGHLRAVMTIPPRWRGHARTSLRLCVVVGVVYGSLLAARGAWAYATTSPRFEVKHLVAAPTLHVDDAHLRELLALEPGTNILSLDLDELSARVTADPWVARALVTRELPDTLHVEVVEHEPRVVVLAERLYLADSRGVLFKRAEGRERGDLPIVTGVDRRMLVDPSPEVRERARGRVLRAIGVLDAWERKRRPRVAEIHVAEYGDVTVFTAETGAQIRLGRGEHGARLARYDALRAALGEQADELAVVHLDSSARPGDVDRVVVRFFDETHARAAMSLTPPRDEAPAPKVEPGENPAVASSSTGAAAAADSNPKAGKTARTRKKLIPRAH